MINGLSSVSRSFSGLLVPMAQYVMKLVINENRPRIASSIGFDKRISLSDVQTDVDKTDTAISSMTAIYDDKIITAHTHYGEFIVNAYAKTREEAKDWMDHFEYAMIKKNQYRGKCLYAEDGALDFKDVPDTKWDDVVLDDKVKHDIRLNTVEFLGDKKLASVGVLKRGIMMYGPPGTGKTSVVKAVFRELHGKNVSRIYVTAESFRKMSVGNLFSILGYLGPTVLAFEDVDLVGGNRDSIHTGGSLLGDLLTNLDGMRKQREPLVVMASTNKISMLDEALSDRPGRFDRKVNIGLPNDANLKRIYFKLVGNNVNDDIIKMSNQFTGSHVVETVNTAKILAASQGREIMDCLKEACHIVKENFFSGQTQIQIQAGIKKHFNKIAMKKTASKILNQRTNIFKFAEEIINSIK